MKLLTTLTILLTQSLVLASCGGQKPTPTKELKKQAVEIQDFVDKAQHEKDTELRQDDVFQTLGKRWTYEQYQDYVARISDDDSTNDEVR